MTRNRFGVGGDRSGFAIGALVALSAATALLLIVSLVSMPAGESVQSLLFVLGDILQLVSIIAFGVWLHRAYANLSALQNPSRYAPAMAVAFFFLPLVSFFLPQAILQEIWRKSAPADPRSRSATPTGPAAPWFESWWYIFIGASIAFNYAVTRSLESATGVGRLTGPLTWAAALTIASAALGASIIRRVDHRQKAAHLVTLLPGFKAVGSEGERSPVRDLLMPIVAMAEEEQRSAADEPARPERLGTSPKTRLRRPSLRELGPRNVLLLALLYLTMLISAIHVIFWGVIILRPLPYARAPRVLVSALLGPTSIAQFLVIGIAAAVYRFFCECASSADAVTRANFRLRMRVAQILWAIALLVSLLLSPRVGLAAIVCANIGVIVAAAGTRRLVFSSARAPESDEEVSAPATPRAGRQ
jgi:hypothetical protein